MNLQDDKQIELGELLEALCEERLSHTQAARLEVIATADPEALRFYLEYLELHGNLYWDASATVPQESAATTALDANGRSSAEPIQLATSGTEPRRSGRRRVEIIAAVAATVLLAVGLAVRWTVQTPDQGPDSSSPGVVADGSPNPSASGNRDKLGVGPSLSGTDQRNPIRPRRNSNAGNPAVAQRPVTQAVDDRAVAQSGSASPAIIAFVNEKIHEGWQAAGVEPSSTADDAEWMRRVYLDLAGHIPPVEEVERFLQDGSSNKREILVERLLDHPDYVRNMTTVWANLLIGRSPSPNADRPALEKFLRTSFAGNRAWDEIVYDLVAAEGASNENGAANFLLAHLNNEAVPATAITARLFLGTQVQCTQCHDHPSNDWKQDQFWELNSFFAQTQVERHRQTDPLTGKRTVVTALVSRTKVGGPIFYENRQGVVSAAYPSFAGERIETKPGINRRSELARLMTSGKHQLVARSMVNRMWSHFFGHGFTWKVDDLGPHSKPTHPELFDRLTNEFVMSGYDLKQLARWICKSAAYGLTSRFNDTNEHDDPAIGEPALFSRAYVKPMSAEQLYDSLLIATRAHYAGQSDWESVEEQRQEWLAQFVHAFGTEENDEASTFEGTISQALMMIDGELIERAIGGSRGTFLMDVVSQRGSERDKIRQLCLSTLSRYPTATELTALRKLLRNRPPGRRSPQNEGLQDVFWAFLNSNEFIVNH